MNIKNFKTLWKNRAFRVSYDSIHKAILCELRKSVEPNVTEVSVERLLPGCNLEYDENSIHVGFLGLNQSLSLSNYKKLQSLLQNTKNECQHLQWIKDEERDFTSGTLGQLYRRYKWEQDEINDKQLLGLVAEQKAFIGEDVVNSIGPKNQQSPIAYFKTLFEIVQWSAALHSNTQPLHIGHFDMFPIRVTNSECLERQFDKKPTFWEECIRSTMNEIQQTMHPSGVLIISNALLIRTCFDIIPFDPAQISKSLTKSKEDNMWPQE